MVIMLLYVPGWDTHGLPVEQQLAKKGVDRKSMDRAKYRELCRQFAEEQVKKQMTDFKRLGVMADWDHPYITLQPKFEAEEIRVFGEMFKKVTSTRVRSLFIGHGQVNQLWLKQKLNTMILNHQESMLLSQLKMEKES